MPPQSSCDCSLCEMELCLLESLRGSPRLQHRHSPAFHSPTHSVKYAANAVRLEVNPS